jgi:hypothetical protein
MPDSRQIQEQFINSSEKWQTDDLPIGIEDLHKKEANRSFVKALALQEKWWIRV